MILYKGCMVAVSFPYHFNNNLIFRFPVQEGTEPNHMNKTHNSHY